MGNAFFGEKVTVFIILFSAVVVSALIFYTSKQYQMPVAVRPNNVPTVKVKLTTNEVIFDSVKPDDIVKKIYQIVDPSSKIQFKKPAKQAMVWVSDDQWNVFDRFAAGIQMPIQAGFCDREVCVRNLNIKILNQKISKIFLYNGFTASQLNTSTSEDDERLYDYVLAFEKDNTRCALSANTDLFSDDPLHPMDPAIRYTVTCSGQIMERYAEELPFLKVLNNHYLSVIVEKIVGDFARIEIGGKGGSGMYGIAKKINDSWKIIIQAQEPPLCELIDRYQVPKEIYPVYEEGCYERSDMPPVFDHRQ